MISYSQSDLYADDTPLADIAARVGTPTYVYSANSIRCSYQAYDEALAPLERMVCYAVKANSTQAILSLLAKAGAAFDIVSGGELYRVLQAVDKVLALIERLRGAGHDIREIDLGGGVGVAYRSSDLAPEIRGFMQKLRDKITPTGLAVMVEPGRSIVGPAGVLLTRVLYR